MINKILLSINILMTTTFNLPVEILDFFELKENTTVFCSENVDEKIEQALFPYIDNKKKEYDVVLFAGFEELEPKALQLKAGGKGIMIAPYGTQAQACQTLKQLGMKIVHKEMHRELGSLDEIKRVHLIFFEKRLDP